MVSSALSAQEGVKIGFFGALPIDDFNDQVTLAAGVEAGYMKALGEVVDLGAMTGLIYGFGEKFTGQIDFPDVQFVPVAASVRVWPSNSFSFGGELGYGIGLNEGNDGGLYYKPLIGYLLGPQSEVNLSYTAIELDGASWTTVNLGFLFTLEL